MMYTSRSLHIVGERDRGSVGGGGTGQQPNFWGNYDDELLISICYSLCTCL